LIHADNGAGLPTVRLLATALARFTERNQN
jgi:hypothetical protein